MFKYTKVWGVISHLSHFYREMELALAHSSKEYNPVEGKVWKQGWKMSGHFAATVRKQRKGSISISKTTSTEKKSLT